MEEHKAREREYAARYSIANLPRVIAKKRASIDSEPDEVVETVKKKTIAKEKIKMPPKREAKPKKEKMKLPARAQKAKVGEDNDNAMDMGDDAEPKKGKDGEEKKDGPPGATVDAEGKFIDAQFPHGIKSLYMADTTAGGVDSKTQEYMDTLQWKRASEIYNEAG